MPAGQAAVGWRVGVYWNNDTLFYYGDIIQHEPHTNRYHRHEEAPACAAQSAQALCYGSSGRLVALHHLARCNGNALLLLPQLVSMTEVELSKCYKHACTRHLPLLGFYT